MSLDSSRRGPTVLRRQLTDQLEYSGCKSSPRVRRHTRKSQTRSLGQKPQVVQSINLGHRSLARLQQLSEAGQSCQQGGMQSLGVRLNDEESSSASGFVEGLHKLWVNSFSFQDPACLRKPRNLLGEVRNCGLRPHNQELAEYLCRLIPNLE